MSGDKHDHDDDFLDDDFVVEDIAGQNDDLETLFEDPSPRLSGPAPGAPPDAEDVLFTDHTAGLQRSEVFGDGPAFAEDADSNWSGESLELEEVGVPVADDYGEVEPATANTGREPGDFGLDGELGEDDFTIDGDQDLEVIDTPAAAGDDISEFEQSGTFTLDDRDGMWSDEIESAATAQEPAEEPAEEPELDLAAQVAGSEPELEAEGWEPLPAKSVDELAEVGEVTRSDEAGLEAAESEYDVSGYTEDPVDPEAVGFQPAARHAPEDITDLDAVEGHDLYAEDEAEVAEVVGAPAARGGRIVHLFASLAASLLVVLGAAAAVMRPEWFGLRFDPDRVERVEVQRPRIEIAVDEPRLPVAAGPQLAAAEVPAPPSAEPLPEVEAPALDQVAVAVPPPGSEPAAPGTEALPPAAEEPGAPQSSAAVAVVVSPPEAAGGAGAMPVWPVAVARPVDPPEGPEPPQLSRLGDDLMVGPYDPAGRAQVATADGIVPGIRAFAQLTNGNYFIGSIKSIGSDRITLRVDNGEVSLAHGDLVRLTQLGSADFDELQKATSGFIRLTNKNRLIGGILSHIADDHVVLEFRKNRVMLPRSAVGEIVQGDGDGEVRLDTTHEEDDWLMRLAARQLGTGKGAEGVRLPDLRQTPRSGPPR